MGTQIKVWEVGTDEVVEVGEVIFGDRHQEKDLEDWVCRHPDLVHDDLLVIARQHYIDTVGIVDLLGIDSEGQLVVVELKRGLAPREAVAQTLDYASWLNSISGEEIARIAGQYLQSSLASSFRDEFGRDLPKIDPQNHKMLLVATQLDISAERIISYLAQNYSIDINAVFFRYARLSNGQEILVRSVLVPEKEGGTVTTAPKMTVTELLSLADKRQVRDSVDILRALALSEEYAGEEAAKTYGGSFRYWRKNLDGKAKMVLGVNVSGERKISPKGSLDLWFPVRIMATVTGESEQQVRERLRQFPVLEFERVDCIVRVTSVAVAREVLEKLKEWLDERPGYYRAAAGAASAG